MLFLFFNHDLISGGSVHLSVQSVASLRDHQSLHSETTSLNRYYQHILLFTSVYKLILSRSSICQSARTKFSALWDHLVKQVLPTYSSVSVCLQTNIVQIHISSDHNLSLTIDTTIILADRQE